MTYLRGAKVRATETEMGKGTMQIKTPQMAELTAISLVCVSAALLFGKAQAQGGGACSFQGCYDNCAQGGGGRTIIPAVSCSKICSKRCQDGGPAAKAARTTMRPTPALRKACRRTPIMLVGNV